MREHRFSFEVDATPDEVWGVLHPPPPAKEPGDTANRVFEYGGVRIEIQREGDADGAGLVRRCTFQVPKLLLTGGVGRSWECVVEARPPDYSRYESVGKPLWSEATGWHQLDDLGEGRTRVEFGETYHAFNPIARLLLEKYVHNFISRDNDRLVRTAVEKGVVRARAAADHPTP